MNINKITISNNTNHNVTGSKNQNKGNINFGYVIYDYQLSKVFASPTFAEPFVNAIRKLQNIPLNLREIINYEHLSPLKKAICDEYFHLIGESEVLDHTVRLKPVFEYCDGCEKYPMRSGVKLYATLPAWRSDYYDVARDGLRLDKDPQFGFIDKDQRIVFDGPYDHRLIDEPTGFEIYPAGKIWCHNDAGACLPTIDGLKEMLRITLTTRIDDICKSMERCDLTKLKTNMEKARQDAFDKMQTLVSGELRVAKQVTPDSDKIDDVRLIAASYKILEDAEKKNSTIDYMIRQIFSIAGINLLDRDIYSYRVKGENNLNSILNRLLTKMRILPSLKKNLAENDFVSAKDHCYDIFGAKINAKSDEEIEHVYNELLKAIHSGLIWPIQVINYHGRWIKPIFTEKQMREMELMVKDRGMTTKFTDKEHPSGSGYTSVNIRARIAGEPVELQIRTRAIDLVAKYFHYSYDVFSGKDVLSSYSPEKQKILKPLVDELLKIKSNKELKTKYNKYTSKCYAVARENRTDFPAVEEFGLPQIVSVENTLKIIELLDK